MELVHDGAYDEKSDGGKDEHESKRNDVENGERSTLKENEKMKKQVIMNNDDSGKPPERKKSARINQRNSYIFEMPNTEGLKDSLILRILDTHKKTLSLFLIRTLLIMVVIVIGTLITFGPKYFPSNTMDIGWSIMGGLMVSSFVIFVVVIGFRKTFYPKTHIIGFDMVKWFSFRPFIDVVYYALNPNTKADVRQTVYAKNPPKVHEEYVVKRNPDDIKLNNEYLTTPVSNIKVDKNHDPEAYFFDFLADTGDGFDPTYAVFASIAKSDITVQNPSKDDEVYVLPRADSVFIGGDIAYPFPKHDAVMGRFIRPISWAFPTDTQQPPVAGHEADFDETDLGAKQLPTGNNPRMYVMPGNHEYYDGLENYTKLIINRDHIGRWKTPAKSPYFAVKLPYNWWIFCLDPGSEAMQDLDKAQVDYFTDIVKNQTTEDDRFILMVHEPDWIKNSGHKFSLFAEMQKFREEVLGDRLRLNIAGDLHYYRRMEEVGKGVTEEILSTNDQEVASYPSIEIPHSSPQKSPHAHEKQNLLSQSSMSSEGIKKGEYSHLGKKYKTDRRQLIVAGHGGAFSHPTCNPTVKEVSLGEPAVAPEKRVKYSVVCDHPTPEQCTRIMDTKWPRMFSWENNYTFGHIVAAMYMLMFAAVSPLSLVYYSNGATPTAWPSASEVLASDAYAIQALSSFYFYPAALWLLIEHFIFATTSLAMHDFNNKCLAYTLAISHTVFHLLFAFGLRKLVDTMWVAIFSSNASTDIQNNGIILIYCAVANVTMYILGFFLGTWITIFYLYSVFTYIGNGHCYNEAFCLFTERDYKGFLRIKIDPNGDLIIYSVGIEKTPRSWRQTEEDERSERNPSIFVPDNNEKLKLILLEQIHLLRDPKRS